jgi:hypothetical protein
VAAVAVLAAAASNAGKVADAVAPCCWLVLAAVDAATADIGGDALGARPAFRSATPRDAPTEITPMKFVGETVVPRRAWLFLPLPLFGFPPVREGPAKKTKE